MPGDFPLAGIRTAAISAGQNRCYRVRPLFCNQYGFSDTNFLIKSDNQGVIHAIEGGKSCSPQQNTVLQRITTLLSQHKLWVSSLYVPSLENLADPPSRGLPASSRSRALSTFTLPITVQPFLSRAPF